MPEFNGIEVVDSAGAVAAVEATDAYMKKAEKTIVLLGENDWNGSWTVRNGRSQNIAGAVDLWFKIPAVKAGQVLKQFQIYMITDGTALGTIRLYEITTSDNTPDIIGATFTINHPSAWIVWNFANYTAVDATYYFRVNTSRSGGSYLYYYQPKLWFTDI